MFMFNKIALLVMIICVIALFYLVIRKYFKGENTLMDTIIGIFIIIVFFIGTPIFDYFLSYNDSFITTLVDFGFCMIVDDSYKTYQVKTLKRKLKLFNKRE